MRYEYDPFAAFERDPEWRRREDASYRPRDERASHRAADEYFERLREAMWRDLRARSGGEK